MGNMGRLFLFAALLQIGLAYGLVTVETRSGNIGDNASRQELLADLDLQIVRGAWDSENLAVPIRILPTTSEAIRPFLSVREGRDVLLVRSESIRLLSASDRLAVVSSLAGGYYNGLLASYRVTVDTAKNDLTKEPALDRLGIDAKALTGILPAESILSEYAKRWAYKLSAGHGPNCWHTSMASIFPNWRVSRRMSADEFACHVRTSFVPIDRPLQWGDLIRLSYGNEEVHGFTFLGIDSKETKRSIVFTKNGRMQSYFLFMDLDTVKNQVYPGNEIHYYRAVKTAVDPREDSKAACAGYPEDNSRAEEPARDPFLAAALRLGGLSALPETSLTGN